VTGAIILIDVIFGAAIGIFFGVEFAARMVLKTWRRIAHGTNRG
jgi:hypothetical protein